MEHCIIFSTRSIQELSFFAPDNDDWKNYLFRVGDEYIQTTEDVNEIKKFLKEERLVRNVEGKQEYRYLYRVKNTNIFAYHHLPNDKGGEKNGSVFLKQIYEKVKNIYPDCCKQKVIFCAHKKDFNRNESFGRVRPDAFEETFKDLEASLFVFEHERSNIAGDILMNFPWDKFRDNNKEINYQGVEEYVFNKLITFNFRQDVYEKIESYAEQLYLKNYGNNNLLNEINALEDYYPIPDSEKENLKEIKEFLADKDKDIKHTKPQFRFLTDNWLKSLDNPVY